MSKPMSISKSKAPRIRDFVDLCAPLTPPLFMPDRAIVPPCPPPSSPKPPLPSLLFSLEFCKI